jgi:hypothetical protein
MFLGYLSYAGTEVWNSERVATYAGELVPGIQVSNCAECEDLAEVLGDKAYTTPFVDQAPWFDPFNPHTWDFCGVVPLSAEGVEDSTTAATVTDLVGGGGYVSSPLPKAREMRFTGLLIGADEAAVEAGMSWLKAVLETNPCSSTPGCTGDHLCYLSACPEICEDSPGYGDPDPRTGTRPRVCPTGVPATDTEGCMFDYLRHMRLVTTTSGPTITQKYSPTCGAMWQVEWTMVAGVPYAYSSNRFIGSTTCPSDQCVVVNEIACEPAADLIVQDPDCPPLPDPPRPPDIIDDCIEFPDEWCRFDIQIPADLVPTWATGIPMVQLRTGNDDVRQLRLRYYSNPFDRPLNQLDGCDYCGEFFISYIPPNSIMTIDGSEEMVQVEQPGGRISTANHLLYGTDGGPVSWPELICGIPFTVVVDVAPALTSDILVTLCVAYRY